MIIEQKDLKKLLRETRNAYEIGCDTVFCPDGSVKPEDFYFCMGTFDVALFYHEHPMTIDDYFQLDVRAVYEALVLIDRKKVPPQEYMYQQKATKDMLIDLGGFVVGRRRLGSLQLQMAIANWSFDLIADPHQRGSKERQVAGILEDLTALCQSETGRMQANELWCRYVPNGVVRPGFLGDEPQQPMLLPGETTIKPREQAKAKATHLKKFGKKSDHWRRNL